MARNIEWRAVREHAQKRLVVMRRDRETHGLSIEKVEYSLGWIHALEYVLALEEQKETDG